MYRGGWEIVSKEPFRTPTLASSWQKCLGAIWGIVLPHLPILNLELEDWSQRAENKSLTHGISSILQLLMKMLLNVKEENFYEKNIKRMKCLLTLIH